jgi:hypothetical protein
MRGHDPHQTRQPPPQTVERVTVADDRELTGPAQQLHIETITEISPARELCRQPDPPTDPHRIRVTEPGSDHPSEVRLEHPEPICSQHTHRSVRRHRTRSVWHRRPHHHPVELTHRHKPSSDRTAVLAMPGRYRPRHPRIRRIHEHQRTLTVPAHDRDRPARHRQPEHVERHPQPSRRVRRPQPANHDINRGTHLLRRRRTAKISRVTPSIVTSSIGHGRHRIHRSVTYPSATHPTGLKP